MPVTIQHARVEDEDEFFSLWVPMMEALEKMGGDVMTTESSVEFFRSLFRAYTTGDLSGVALFARDEDNPIGALMWGDIGKTSMDRADQKSVFGWGSYVIDPYRRMGVDRLMRQAAIVELHHQGVETAMGSVILRNGPGVESARKIGFRPTQILGRMEIAEEAHGILNPDSGSGTETFYWEGHCPLCGRDE